MGTLYMAGGSVRDTRMLRAFDTVLKAKEFLSSCSYIDDRNCLRFSYEGVSYVDMSVLSVPFECVV